MAKRTAPPKGAEESAAQIVLERMKDANLSILIRGTAPLIVHQWSAKAKQQMLDAQQGRKKTKEIRDPAAEFEASIYRLTDGSYGFPASGIKKAIVSGGRFFKGAVTMTQLKPLLYVAADDPLTGLVRLDASDPTPREDMVKVGQGTDLRYRAEFKDWRVTMHVEFLPHMIDAASVVALVDAAGRVGLGEWRPEKAGTNGTFTVEESA